MYILFTVREEFFFAKFLETVFICQFGLDMSMMWYIYLQSKLSSVLNLLNSINKNIKIRNLNVQK